MKNPHRKFVEALVCGKMASEDIANEMVRWGLPFQNSLITKSYTAFKDKDPPWYAGKSEDVNPDLLKELKVAAMYGYIFNRGVDVDVTPVEEAFSFLENRNIRTLLFAMSLAGMDSEEVELIINEKFEVNATSAGIDAFMFYFFNMDGFSYKEKEELEKGFTADVQSRRAFRWALKHDKQYMLWKLGANPNKSFDEMLRDMLTDSYFLFKEKSKSSIDDATKLGTLAVKLADRLERVMDNDRKADDMFSEFKFDPEETHDLSASLSTAEELGAETGFDFEAEEISLADEIKSADTEDYVVVDSEDMD